MASYAAYVEISAEGTCLAHVLALPGCAIRAPTREEALRRLLEAIREYHAWLDRHGEKGPLLEESIHVEVAGESLGCGPFDPGDAAALFPPDQQPVSVDALDRYLRLMEYSRADLLALVRDLSDEVLDWQHAPGEMTIRRILRHVGNAEEWYVSRIVPLDTLPPEWDQDHALPLLEFLEMERRTVVKRLRKLGEVERSATSYPDAWTDHPDEPWTARKVLRRFLEHEREHTAQVRRILNTRRRHLLARLAAERAGLMQQLLGLDYHSLTEIAVTGGWSVKDVLAHIAAWDRWEQRIMRAMQLEEVVDLSAVHDVDSTNQSVVAQWRGQAFDDVLEEAEVARAEWTQWLGGLAEEEFFRGRRYGGWDWSFPGCMEVQWRHDADHAAQIAAWRADDVPVSGPAARSVLLAALAAAREELMAAVALVPEEQRTTRPLCGDWTLKDVLGHVGDWEWIGVEFFGSMAGGQPSEIQLVTDIDAWNASHAKACASHSWDAVCADLQASRQQLVEIVCLMSSADLMRSHQAPWGKVGASYDLICEYVSHDREHAQGLRVQLSKG
jgi:uncharacterized damage-inducible protein DinB/predicted RNase H-like HicB family nuclease